MMNEQELLAVLDMSEDKQAVWCEAPEHGNRQMGQSLADLAFRLRDEVVKNIDDAEVFHKSCKDVIIYLKVKVVGFCDPGTIHDFYMFNAKPIHWIIAALIAKGKEDE